MGDYYPRNENPYPYLENSPRSTRRISALPMSGTRIAPYGPPGEVHRREAPYDQPRSRVTAENGDILSSAPNKAAAVQEAANPIPTDQYNHTESIWRVIADIVSLVILAVVTVIAHYIAAPFERGFTCADSTIKYPYKGNTIPTYAAVIISIGVPVVGMIVTEVFKVCYFTRYKKAPFRVRLEFCGGKGFSVKPLVRNLYILAVIFAYGYLTTWVLTEVSKNFVGRLRPHFLSVCQPSFNCSSVTNFNQFHSYLQPGVDYVCLNSDSTLVREARRSFISGHTSPVFYGCAFLIMYLHVAWSWRHLGIVGHLLQTGLAVLACYIGFTRIFDYHHHWQDVFAGAIVGSVVAFFTFKFILNWRHYDPRFLPYIVSGNRTQSAGFSGGSGVPSSTGEYNGHGKYQGLYDRP